MSGTGEDASASPEEQAKEGTEESYTTAKLRADVAQQQMRLAKDQLKRARKRFKEARREAKRARKLADVARRAWKRHRKKRDGNEPPTSTARSSDGAARKLARKAPRRVGGRRAKVGRVGARR